MKNMMLAGLIATLPLALISCAQVGPQKQTEAAAKPADPVRVSVAPAPPRSQALYIYEQKPIPARPALITPQQAQAIIDKFKAAYAKLGSPRLIVLVNRPLVEKTSAAKAGAATSTEVASPENHPPLDEHAEPTLADRQTGRDVERLFGRPLRQAGVSLADQSTGTELIGVQSPVSLSSASDQARKDRETLSRIADVAIEVLIASKTVTVAEFSGDKTYSMPDIEATAIRLKDAQIIGQASTADILGGDPRYDVREVTEATALALMEDMLTGLGAPARANAKP